jgi:hypothetical protein
MHKKISSTAVKNGKHKAQMWAAAIYGKERYIRLTDIPFFVIFVEEC